MELFIQIACLAGAVYFLIAALILTMKNIQLIFLIYLLFCLGIALLISAGAAPVGAAILVLLSDNFWKVKTK